MKTFFSTIIILFPLFFLKTNPAYPQGFKSISVPSENYVILAGDSGKVFRSFDSGLSWVNIPGPSVNFNSVFSRNFYTYLTAGDSKVYRTFTFANSIIIDIVIPGNYKFNSVYFFSDSIGLICGE